MRYGLAGRRGGVGGGMSGPGLRCMCVCVARGGGRSAVFSLLFVYPEFPNTKLLAF